MNIVFMGTSEFAVPSLTNLLISSHDIQGVITQPDRPRGRGNKLGITPIKQLALQHGLAISQPVSIKDSSAIEQVKSWQPDLIVVVSYGQIIPWEILTFPKFGCVNLHASLLPRYRGAAPIQRALMNGETVSGVTTMFMDEGLDTGDILFQLPIRIEDNYDHGMLEKIMAEQGAKLIIDTIEKIQNNCIIRYPQEESEASYANRIQPQDERINWCNPALHIHNQIRALSPVPGAWFLINGYKVKVFKSNVVDNRQDGDVAQIIEIGSNSFWVKCGQGILEIVEIQKEGKKRMSVRDFLRGNKLEPGTILA
ncbi:MAG: methionyl-tRNA formyltransferase [Syntrophomonadaceae bacterium]